MIRFNRLTGVAAPMPVRDLDTDRIIPARFLKTLRRSGLGAHLFDSLRYDAGGREIPDFVLNREPWRSAQILVAHENFGCGSSREHAAWALLDFGIRCVIAPSFADIFTNNAFRSGVLPVALPRPACDDLIADAALGPLVTVDLERQVVVRPSGEEISFETPPLRRRLLLEGLDDIGQTLRHAEAIGRFEARRAMAEPWRPDILAV